MKIILNTRYASERLNAEPGDVLAVPLHISDAEARDLIAGGYARDVQTAAIVPPVPAAETEGEAAASETAEAPAAPENAAKRGSASRSSAGKPKA